MLQGLGPTSFNWHGSIPTAQADTHFEANFCHFDFFLDTQAMPDEALAEQVYKVPEGESHWHLRTFWGQNLCCMPVVITSIPGAGFVNFFHPIFKSCLNFHSVTLLEVLCCNLCMEQPHKVCGAGTLLST
ncbi:hypothetical protein TraAM80_04340 [Trypanosoma rangeli]|uniref:Uncharacterized protein n=1 Tax=Trypanosoma rangeli TaxID=5698 RepID=A0A3R7RK67_TRYRA|nr:uncharacterized protein TraAM80_04340 [Trypanosoma rangeli]RNF05807.1 hypothetical protein TraAM80_04340 [Trypanosoma rangeli]|eukprot:RNF05807.1 hypothetical protein TraAM80_04340 [Trypanosoma rangeli]